MVLAQPDLITVDGIPAHPLLVHAVVVLLPLAALGGLVIALRATWRRRFGPAVLALTAAAVAAVPLTTRTGKELQAALPAPVRDSPPVQQHAELGDGLLPFALAFGIAVLLLVIAGRLADRERGAADAAAGTDSLVGDASVGDGSDGAVRVTRTWRRIAIVAAALVAFTGVAATVQVIRVGHSGSTAVWQGVGSNP